jgi:hypothetical protein
MRRVDLTGQRLNKLTVISYSHSHIQPSKQKRAVWNVRCDCGNQFKASYATLTCCKNQCNQCAIKDRGLQLRKDVKKTAINYLFIRYRKGAEERNLTFSLNKEQFEQLITKNCHYCNEQPKQLYKNNKSKYHKIEFLYNGIDRVDNKMGYELKNCVSCCKICNVMKATLTKHDFIEHIKKIFLNKEFL